MGKASRQQMTGLNPEGRVQRSLEIAEEEERQRAEVRREMFRQQMEALAHARELRQQPVGKPLAIVTVDPGNLPDRVTISDQFLLDGIERKLRLKAVKGEKKSD